jgi:signal transduction histidine kinase
MARGLHDTFLQFIQACTMVADNALDIGSDAEDMRRTMQKLSKWLNQATKEGRAALNSLRSSTTETNDLARALRRATKNGLIPASMTVNFSVTGESREMHPIVRDEVYRIGYEAIRNAIVHSYATRLQVELRYEQDLYVRVKDNGVGIDSVVLSQGKDEHFGLQGMKERAARIGGKLTLISAATFGTEVVITVPGSIVFRKFGRNV